MKIVCPDGILAPSFANPGDAGMDLRAKESTRIWPGGRALIQTGVRISIPHGTVGLVCSRSGLALKHGVFVLNAPGVIDSGYTGEIGVILYNSGDDPFDVTRGDRIAQFLVMPVLHPVLEFVTTLDATERGEGGFGSSGT